MKKQFKCLWQQVEMIPVIMEMTRDMFHTLSQHLDKLEYREETLCQSLDEMTYHHIVKGLEEQNNYIAIYREQCQLWRQQDLSKRQDHWVESIEHNLRGIEQLNNRILELAIFHRRTTLGIVLH